MVKLRLKRIGKKNQPHYRIVVTPARTKRDGKSLDYLGYYNPRTNPKALKIDKEKTKKWLSNGAQPTDTVRYLLIKEGILPKSAKKNRPKTIHAPKKKKQARKTGKEGTGKEKTASKENVVKEVKDEKEIKEVKEEKKQDEAENEKKAGSTKEKSDISKDEKKVEKPAEDKKETDSKKDQKKE